MTKRSKLLDIAVQADEAAKATLHEPGTRHFDLRERREAAIVCGIHLENHGGPEAASRRSRVKGTRIKSGSPAPND